MLDLFRRNFVKVEVIDSSALSTQHGTAFVRAEDGTVQKLGIAVDRPELLADAGPEVVEQMFEQLGRQGYIPQSLEIATLGNHSTHEAPPAARVLEKLTFGI